MAGLLLWLALALDAPVPFTLVNGAAAPLEELSIRPADGQSEWRPLGPGRLSPGARASVPAQAGQLCAFDIRARVGGAIESWPSVNLCDVKTVTLHLRADGTHWVDYD